MRPVERSQIAAVDVAYRAETAVIACVTFNDWTDCGPASECVIRAPIAAAYVPGRFYERELPCLLRAVEELPSMPDYLLVDGFVWLDEQSTPGLGAHAWSALQEQVIVIGVAKNPLGHLPPCCPVTRGSSAKPLYVSAAGMPPAEAAELVLKMHGEHRLPTLLRRVDQLSRGVAT